MWKPGRTAGRHLRRHSRRNGRHVRHMFSQECASQSSYSVDRPKPAYLAFTVPPGYSRSGCSIPRKRAESGSSQAEAFCSGQSLPYRGQGFRLIPSADHSSYEWGAKSRSTVHQIFVRHPHYTQSQLFQGAKKNVQRGIAIVMGTYRYSYNIPKVPTQTKPLNQPPARKTHAREP